MGKFSRKEIIDPIPPEIVVLRLDHIPMTPIFMGLEMIRPRLLAKKSYPIIAQKCSVVNSTARVCPTIRTATYLPYPKELPASPYILQSLQGYLPRSGDAPHGGAYGYNR